MPRTPNTRSFAWCRSRRTIKSFIESRPRRKPSSAPRRNISYRLDNFSSIVFRVWFAAPLTKEYQLQVFVRDNNVDQALRVLKKKMQGEGLFRDMRQRRSYKRPPERKSGKKSEEIRRARKLARKKAQREGLI